ncbi:hypothetical protein NFI96_031585 [Prochilodus magdalenae]|nr:hypothetical protein NFI96_031585 [Prochilodus magdalenae]
MKTDSINVWDSFIRLLFLFLTAVCGVSAHVPHRYVVVSESKTWTEAQNYCRQTYTDLATINTMEEMKKLSATLNDKPSSSVWIGLSRGGTGKWQWSLADGGFYSEGGAYRNWNSGEPDNAKGKGNEFCVGMFKDKGTWFDVSCDGPFTFVCYDEKKTNTERYVFINEKKSWYEAQSYCRDHHTDLVRVRNQTENQQVFNLTKQSHSDSHIWIGLFNDSWTWSDQSDSSFRYWKSGPDHYGQGGECAAVSITEKGRWDNEICSNQLPFICHQNKLILIQQNLTWREALWYCRENHLDLVSVHSEEIQLWVKEVAQKASTEHLWLGLRHTCAQSLWYWVSGFSICYQNWAPGNGTGGEDCWSVERTGAVQSGGGQQWVSLPENQKLNFICTTYEAVCEVSAHVPHQYVFVKESKTWTEAQNYCRQTYTDLATINTMEEMKKLNATLTDKTSSSVWIGLSRGRTWKWQWSLADGGFYSEGGAYQNWSSGEPDNAKGKGNEFCVGMFKDKGTWFDVRCDAPFTFVCYDEKKTNTERYVFINKEKKSWYEAQSYCRDHHTDLVRVRNQTENQQIFNLTTQSHSDSDIWIGLFNDSWTWSDQSDSSFRYWKSGPDDYGQGDECAAVSITEKGQWDNETCSNQLPFICHQNKLILIQQNLTWSEALWYCREKHLDLVSVHSEEIQLWVMEVAQNASTEHVWLGLRHTCTLSFWFWVSGESICYQNWAPGYGTGEEDCGSVERTGAVQSGGEQQWVSLPENQKLNFICTTYEAMCGVSAYVPHRYIFVKESKTWFEAQSYCRQTYTDLVTINTTEEMKSLNARLKDKVTSLFWIGLIRGSTGKWLWSLANGSSYSELAAYLNWRGGEPNNLGQNEYCVGMFIKDGTWFDVSCFYPHCFVCYDDNKANTERYIFIYKWKNMSDAQSYCREHHTDLASVRNQTESCFNVDRFWISLVNDSWTWSDQSNSSFQMDQNWVSIITFFSAVCGVSAHVPHQYVFVSESKTWTEAQNYCRQTYTDLATINTMEEMKKLNATLKDKPSSSVWIGLSRGGTGKWLWSLADGGVYSEGGAYRNWNSGEPSGAGNNEFCVGMFRDKGTWFDVTCHDQNPFTCYDEKKTNTERYVFINEKKSWYEAQSYCRDHHTDLVRVRNQTENQQVFNLTKQSHSDSHIWIGLFNDSWTWSDGSDSSFRYWKSGPDHYGQGAECAAVSITEKGRWDKETCSNQLPFICHQNKLILIQQNLTWREALWYCREKHLDLVSVHSEEIQLWVMEVAQKASTEHVWLGLRHTCAQSLWYWVSGFSICYQNWAPGNGTGGEDCWSVERTGAVQSGGEQQWVSLPENQKLNFICTTYEVFFLQYHSYLKPGYRSHSSFQKLL